MNVTRVICRRCELIKPVDFGQSLDMTVCPECGSTDLVYPKATPVQQSSSVWEDLEISLEDWPEWA